YTRALHAVGTDLVTQVGLGELDDRLDARRSLWVLGRFGLKVAGEVKVGDTSRHHPREDLVTIAQTNDREFLGGELPHGRVNPPRTARELLPFEAPVLAGWSVAASLGIDFLPVGIEIKDIPIPEQHPFLDELLEVFPYQEIH